MASLSLKNLNKIYDNNVQAVFDFNIDIKDGELIVLVGPSGCGKSTTLRMVAGLEDISSGQLIIDGKDVTAEDFTEDDVYDVRRKVGMVFQNPDNQLVATVVEEDVAFGPENLGLPREEIRRRVNSALEIVGMQDYIRHAPHKLSGGQKQRVAIAGIIAMKPDVIIFDESTAMLDPLGRREVVDVMERLNREEGLTILNITHYMEEAARADRVIVINDGKLAFDGTPYEVFSEVERLHAIGLESPQGTELVRALCDAGLDIKGKALTEDECIEALYNYLSKSKEK